MSKKRKKFEWRIPRLSFRVKVALIIVGVVVVLSVIMLIIMLIIGRGNLNNAPAGTSAQIRTRDEKVKIAQRDGALHDSAQAELNKGNAQDADSIYQQAISSEADATRKVELAIQESDMLYEAKKPDQALDVAKQAESYSSDKYLIADWLSVLYENQHQYALAEQYYILAGQWASSPTNNARLPKAYYDTQAARVNLLKGQK